ncbi:mitochondrial carrier [Linderina pennispora]|uniref:Mitochondrial carrier n=1 Tax=Linderina pennispora TaxID=61395 RepID=A0A1Y1WG29_9FUNG|nr:mitochondrial carrier [Linderina pennispora]ORX72469.1 mitochondrial carrier [Linderina pennispora]
MSLSKESLPPVGHAIAGAGSSALALFLIYPLDTIKTRMQVQTSTQSYKSPIDAVKQILQREGLSGLYAGLVTNLVNQVINGFVYFYAYSVVRGIALKALAKSGGKTLSTVAELTIGALAGMVNQLITLPIGVHWTDTVREIIRTEGVQGLWAGFRPAMLLCSNPAITYGVFERVKGMLTKDRADQFLSSGEAFWVGALAKTLATVVTYPYIMAKVRLQWRPSKQELAVSGDEVVYKSSADVLQKVLRREGIPGLYKGMQTQIIKAVITQALMLMIKESFTLQVVRVFALLSKRKGAQPA